MRILCINYEYPPIGGGGASACKGLVESFVRQGHEVDLITSGMKGLPEYEEINGVHIYRVKCIRQHKHFARTPELISQVYPSYKKALELISKNHYDINHTHFVVPSGLVSYLIKRKTGLDYVVTAHGSDIAGYNPDRFSFMHRLMAPLWKMIVRNSIGLTAPSYFLKKLIHEAIDAPVEVIPNGFDIKPVKGIRKENRILVVSRMFERKGIQYLIEALQDVPAGWDVWIVGDGPYLPTLKNLAEKLGVSVKFMGQVPNDEIFDIYLKSKIYVFPSTVENFPVVLLEAMAAGCAVITSTAAGCVEVVGNAAIKAETGCVEELRRELQFLMNNQQEIHKLGLLGQKRVNNFAWNVVTNRFVKLFERITVEQAHDSKVQDNQQLDNLVELNPVKTEEATPTLANFDEKQRYSG
jgi:glycosyltransferase involved in cell wall biosynthesis